MKDISKQLDILIQQQASKHRCYYCGTAKNVVGHHLIRRQNMLYRWDLNNILPVCVYCHTKIHNGELKEPTKIENQIGFKDYLLQNGLTELEFMQQKYKELTGKEFAIKEKQQRLIHKPKGKKEKTPYQLALQQKQREYRKQQYKKLKEIKRVDK